MWAKSRIKLLNALYRHQRLKQDCTYIESHSILPCSREQHMRFKESCRQILNSSWLKQGLHLPNSMTTDQKCFNNPLNIMWPVYCSHNPVYSSYRQESVHFTIWLICFSNLTCRIAIVQGSRLLDASFLDLCHRNKCYCRFQEDSVAPRNIEETCLVCSKHFTGRYGKHMLLFWYPDISNYLLIIVDEINIWSAFLCWHFWS